MLDIKHINNDKHIKLTGKPNDRILNMARWLSDHGRSMWIRHVYVPGIHDDEQDLLELGRFIGSLKGVEKFEILPYHVMGIFKWQELGWDYPLEGVEPPTDEEIERAYRIIREGQQQVAASK
ncbi:Pyruvate formate-lyase-activating enzyme [compost metagenome]